MGKVNRTSLGPGPQQKEMFGGGGTGGVGKERRVNKVDEQGGRESGGQEVV